MLPNNRPNHVYKLKQLHNLYQAVPKLQQSLILPFAGFNPKSYATNKKWESVRKETNGEIDFSVWEERITHVVHISSMEDYKWSSLDREEDDSVYIHGKYDKEDGPKSQSQRDGNPMFGMRQNLMGVDHILFSLLSSSEQRKENNASPIHFTHVSDVDVLSLSYANNAYGKCQTMDKKQRACSDFQASTKLMEEILFQNYQQKSIHNDSFVTVRVPLVYGPWGNVGSMEYDLAELAVQHWNNSSVSLSTLASNEDWDLFQEQDVLFVDGKW